MEETITISKEDFDELVKNTVFLQILVAHGVDNWSGYDDACVEYEEEYPDEK